MSELESIRIFIKVAELGSFSKAANLLKIPKSTASRTVSRLESESGTRLLTRTTRSLTLTASGRALLEHCRAPLQALEEARKSIQDHDSIVAGLVRITAPEDLGTYVLSPAVGELAHRHPALSFELHYTDELVDLVRDGFDLAFRIGNLKSSGYKALRVGEISLVTVASPHYLKAHPAPKTPQDLKNHACLTYRSRTAAPTWALSSLKKNAPTKTISVALLPKVTSNQMTSLLKLAVQGAGIALIPHYLCNQELQSGKLIRVLPDWKGETFPLSLVSPSGGFSSGRLKVISQTLQEAIQKKC